MFEENFGVQLSKMLQNEGLSMLIILKIFTMVEENFGSQLSEMLPKRKVWECLTLVVFIQKTNYTSRRTIRLKYFSVYQYKHGKNASVELFVIRLV